MEGMDPVIRRAHKAVDLSSAMGDIEVFLKDLVKVAKIGVPKGSVEVLVPSVSDFVQLLRKHRPSLLKYQHQALKNDGMLREWFFDTAKQGVKEFRDDSNSSSLPSAGGAGKLAEDLNSLFFSIPQEEREKMMGTLDQYVRYLEDVSADTMGRLQNTLDGAKKRSKNPVLEKVLKREQEGSIDESPKEPDWVSSLNDLSIGKETVMGVDVEAGPGGYLGRWKDLMDRQKVTIQEAGGDENGEKILMRGGVIERPDTSLIEEMLGAKFRQVLGVKGMDW